MIKIEFREPDDDGWKDWRERCDVATRELIEAVANGSTPVISEDLYKEQKHSVYMALRGPFYGKCAYCEGFLAADQPGDIEHYRPKKRVTINNYSMESITFGEGGTIKPHPGYYWLAYDWQNLLPSCIDCNRPNETKIPGKHMGKRNYFPVRDFRAVRPGEETQEEPLLLNPVIQNPDNHLSIDSTGVFESLSDEGKECIEVFCLNDREALVDARKTAYEGVKASVFMLTAALQLDSPEGINLLNQLQAIKAGEKPYSAAARVAIKIEGQKLDPLMRILR